MVKNKVEEWVMRVVNVAPGTVLDAVPMVTHVLQQGVLRSGRASCLNPGLGCLVLT